MVKLTKLVYGRLAACLLRLIRLSLRFDVKNQPLDEPVVYGFWHRNLMYCALQRAGDRVAVIVSPSKDGDLIAIPIARLGYAIARGSSSRQGAQALKTLLRFSKTHSLAITPDGPKGPVGTIHPGIFQLALLAKIPIVAVACDADREWVFNSWDKFRFPKPFAKIRVVYSDPIYVTKKEDIPLAEEAFRDFLAEAEASF